MTPLAEQLPPGAMKPHRPFWQVPPDPGQQSSLVAQYPPGPAHWQERLVGSQIPVQQLIPELQAAEDSREMQLQALSMQT